METHDDRDALNATDRLGTIRDKLKEAIAQELAARAEKMTADGTNQITAGHGECAIAEEEVKGFGLIRKLPNDPLCLRISIGEVLDGSGKAYFVFRGDAYRIERLLEQVVRAFRPSQFEGDL